MHLERIDIGPTAATLRLDGRLNLVAAPRLRAAVDDVVQSGATRVVLDLSAVTFMDSSGLGALIAGLKVTRQAGGDLRIAGVTEQVASVLRLTNLDRVLRSYPSPQAAADGW
jgi:anti-sigma B factor antagonist